MTIIHHFNSYMNGSKRNLLMHRSLILTITQNQTDNKAKIHGKALECAASVQPGQARDDANTKTIEQKQYFRASLAVLLILH